MYDTNERTRQVKLRVEKLQSKEDSRLIASLFGLCAVLSIFLLGAIGSMVEGGSYIGRGFYGSIMMYEDVGSHVLVSVISFTLAVAITVACIRYREKNKKI